MIEHRRRSVRACFDDSGHGSGGCCQQKRRGSYDQKFHPDNIRHDGHMRHRRAWSDTMPALGEYSQGDDHREAISLIEKVIPDGRELGKALSTLLGLKITAQYGAEPLTKKG